MGWNIIIARAEPCWWLSLVGLWAGTWDKSLLCRLWSKRHQHKTAALSFFHVQWEEVERIVHLYLQSMDEITLYLLHTYTNHIHESQLCDESSRWFTEWCSVWLRSLSTKLKCYQIYGEAKSYVLVKIMTPSTCVSYHQNLFLCRMSGLKNSQYRSRKWPKCIWLSLLLEL